MEVRRDLGRKVVVTAAEVHPEEVAPEAVVRLWQLNQRWRIVHISYVYLDISYGYLQSSFFLLDTYTQRPLAHRGCTRSVHLDRGYTGDLLLTMEICY